MKVNSISLDPDFSLPIFVFEGPDDSITSPDLATAWVNAINTPRNEFPMLHAGSHFAVFTHPEAFLKSMNSRVRPLALTPPQLLRRNAVDCTRYKE